MISDKYPQPLLIGVSQLILFTAYQGSRENILLANDFLENMPDVVPAPQANASLHINNSRSHGWYVDGLCICCVWACC